MFFSWSRNRSFGKGPKKRDLADINYNFSGSNGRRESQGSLSSGASLELGTSRSGKNEVSIHTYSNVCPGGCVLVGVSWWVCPGGCVLVGVSWWVCPGGCVSWWVCVLVGVCPGGCVSWRVCPGGCVSWWVCPGGCVLVCVCPGGCVSWWGVCPGGCVSW
uniref:Uncharacterized protein n=1 Tax=Oncorhynchus tshawytscha TaxID=74940 RepID=A0AAZ3SU70_ONCTS